MRVVSQERFIAEALKAHNEYRKKHGVSKLKEDPRLSGLAKEWAEDMADRNVLEYRNFTYKGAEVGQNIMRLDLSELGQYYFRGEKATDEWYQEESEYDYSGAFNPNCGHFTQIVWKNTEKVGFGFSFDEKGVFYVVANYLPAGNYANEFLKNVLPLENTLKRHMPPLPPNSVEPSVPLKPVKNSFFDEIEKQIQVHKNNAVEDTISVLDESIDESNYEFDSAQQRFIKEALEQHNKCRRQHGCSDLVHNPELSFIAQEYSEKLAKRNKMEHSKNKYKGEKIGENLAYSYDSRLNFYAGEKATMQWYDEIYDHDFNLDYQKGTGHFTQLVWKNTREVGFGVSKAKDGSFYAVANYYPAGNFLGRFVQNVPKRLN